MASELLLGLPASGMRSTVPTTVSHQSQAICEQEADGTLTLKQQDGV